MTLQGVRQSRWAVVLLSSRSVNDQGPLLKAPVMYSQCYGRLGVRRQNSGHSGGSSYMAEGLDGTGFSSGPCQTVPHGGRGVGGRMERVLFSQRQHHSVRLRRHEMDCT